MRFVDLKLHVCISLPGPRPNEARALRTNIDFFLNRKDGCFIEWILCLLTLRKIT